VQLIDNALQERNHLGGILSQIDGEAGDCTFIRSNHVDVNVADAELFGEELDVDALALFLFLGRGAAIRVGGLFVLAGDRNEILVQDFDYFTVGERTRPQAKGPASTTAGIDFAVIGKQEDGPVYLRGNLFGGEDAGCPSDFVEALFRAGGLHLADLILDRADELIVLDPGLDGSRQKGSGKQRQAELAHLRLFYQGSALDLCVRVLSIFATLESGRT
jgi:hypothetical protein